MILLYWVFFAPLAITIGVIRLVIVGVIVMISILADFVKDSRS